MRNRKSIGALRAGFGERGPTPRAEGELFKIIELAGRVCVCVCGAASDCSFSVICVVLFNQFVTRNDEGRIFKFRA